MNGAPWAKARVILRSGIKKRRAEMSAWRGDFPKNRITDHWQYQRPL